MRERPSPTFGRTAHRKKEKGGEWNSLFLEIENISLRPPAYAGRVVGRGRGNKTGRKEGEEDD